jgi:predicted MFS family arabinose efflux permease
MLLALRIRDFRLFWFGLNAQIVGQQMTQFTLGWLAYEITGSPLRLGAVNIAGAIPRVVFTLFGGVLADRLDQRKLIASAQGVSAAVIVALGTLTLVGAIEFWHLMVASFFIGVSQSIDEPSRTSLYPSLLPDRSYISSAVPLISMAWSSTRVIAPAIAGFLVAAAGADTTFFISAAGAATMVAMMRLIKPRSSDRRASGNVLKNLLEGVQYVRKNEVFSRIVGAGFVHGGFGMGYVFMLPVFAKDVFEVDARGLGILTASAGIGSFVGLFTFNWLHGRMRPSTVIVWGLTLFSVSLIVFSLSPWFWLALPMMALTGAAHIYFQTTSQVVLLSLVDDQYRGRVMSLYGMLWSFLLVGGAALNAAAEFVTPEWALTSGCVVVLLYTWLVVARSRALQGVTLVKKDEQASAAGS